jgi:hypothetical protein
MLEEGIGGCMYYATVCVNTEANMRDGRFLVGSAAMAAFEGDDAECALRCMDVELFGYERALKAVWELAEAVSNRLYDIYGPDECAERLGEVLGRLAPFCGIEPEALAFLLWGTGDVRSSATGSDFDGLCELGRCGLLVVCALVREHPETCLGALSAVSRNGSQRL